MPAAASLKSLSISSRLSLGFGCMLVLIIAVAALGQLSVSQVNGQMHQITGTGANKAKLVNGMLESVSAIGIQSRSAAMLNEIDPKQARDQIALAYSSDSQCVRAGMIEGRLDLLENNDAAAIRAHAEAAFGREPAQHRNRARQHRPR